MDYQANTKFKQRSFVILIMEIRRRPPNPSVKVANLEYSIPHPDSKPRNILEEIVWEKDTKVRIGFEHQRRR